MTAKVSYQNWRTQRPAPAEEYGKQMNGEPVWLTPVFPFRLDTALHGDREIAQNSYNYCMKERPDVFRPFKLGNPPYYTSYSGWQYGGMAAALLELTEGEKIHLLPAWTKGWDVSFRLYAPRNTVVTCVYRNGAVEQLCVEPPERAKDVVMPQ